MIFEQIATGGCQSYLIGCSETSGAALIDPELSQIDRSVALAARDGLRIRYLIDTHTHADHFTATKQLAQQLDVPVVMHRASSAPFVNMRIGDGEMIVVGKLRLHAFHTPGHTSDSMCLRVKDCLFTGDTLLIGATGRTDLPSGDPEALYDSLFNGLLRLRNVNLKVFPAHDYKGRQGSTIGQELATNPPPADARTRRFRRDDAQPRYPMPTRVRGLANQYERREIRRAVARRSRGVRAVHGARRAQGRASKRQKKNLIVLDVREHEKHTKPATFPVHARCLADSWNCTSNQELPDPTRRILTCCELGYVSTLAAATLRQMGFRHAGRHLTAG